MLASLFDGSGWLPALLGLHGSLLVAAVAGVLAGILNAIAGGGGFFVLPALYFGGLSASVANGTMRVGILAQSISAVIAFQRGGVSDWPVTALLSVPITAGALVGAFVATRVSGRAFKPIVGTSLVFWGVWLLFRPGQFVAPDREPQKPGLVAQLLFGAIGLYGGFLQAGVGLPILGLLVSHLGYSPVRANGIKLALILVYTALVLPVFFAADQIAWAPAIALSLGMLVGGWTGVQLQFLAGKALVHWALVAVIFLSGAAMLLG